MGKKILLPTDFSDYAHKTAEVIPQLGSISGVVLLHVLASSRDTQGTFIAGHEYLSLAEYARTNIEKEKKFIEAEGIAATSIITVAEKGNIPDTVLDIAKREQVSLIMMGARGRGIIGGLLLGSVSDGVVKVAKTDVLITQYRTPFRNIDHVSGVGIEQYPGGLFSRVLVPVDFSKPSDEGIHYLISQYEVSGLIFLHVISSAETRQELERKMKESYRELQQRWRAIDEGQTDVKILIRFGNPAQEICDLAEEENVSLVFIPRFGASDYIRNIPIGSTCHEVVKRSKRPTYVFFPTVNLEVTVRELRPDEFTLAEEVWVHYHQQKADRAKDRIFGVFLESTLVCVARCRAHPDGSEVDGVFTLDEYRGRGYARIAMDALIAACGDAPLYMHSTLELVDFYSGFGFRSIPEEELPEIIKTRYLFANGNMRGSNVQPMKRLP